jgi:hypothetical protein
MVEWKRIGSDLRKGLERLRKGTLTAPDLAARGMNVLKLNLDLRKLDESLKGLYTEVGRRVYDRMTTPDASLEAKDDEVEELLKEIRKKLSEREKAQAELEELGRQESDESLST